jgi:PhzF family phenazine biosynthesis protein
MTGLPFRQVDVFTAVPFKGNPVAVVLDGNSLSTARMQAIANWTNLSETTFACAPTHAQADYRLRIFTPRSELPFAGHPTIGSAHAVLEHGLKPKHPGRLVQECGRGLVTIEIDGERLFLALPKPNVRELSGAQSAELAAALGIPAERVRARAVVDVGVVWITLQLADAETVRGLQPDQARLAALTPSGTAGVTVFGLYGAGHVPHVEVRSFAPAEGIPEDPVCGSGNGCVAALVRQERLISHRDYIAGQGQCMGRDGRVEVRYADDGTIWLGGHAVTCVQGVLAAGDGTGP